MPNEYKTVRGMSYLPPRGLGNEAGVIAERLEGEGWEIVTVSLSSINYTYMTQDFTIFARRPIPKKGDPDSPSPYDLGALAAARQKRKRR